MKYLPKLPCCNDFKSSVCCDQLKDVVQLRNIFFPGSGGRERFVRDSRANIMVKGIKMKEECRYRHAAVGNLLEGLLLFLPNGFVEIQSGHPGYPIKGTLLINVIGSSYRPPIFTNLFAMFSGRGNLLRESTGNIDGIHENTKLGQQTERLRIYCVPRLPYGQWEFERRPS